MAANLKFESVAGTTAADLDQVKIITLADNTGNQYTLDITTGDLKVGYTPNGGQITEHKITGLSTALGSLLSTKDNNKSVLVNKLGEFLGSTDKAKYDGRSNQTVKEFLVGKGLKGEKGDTGDKGADGKDGAQGPQGKKGEPGPKGADGKDGAQGLKGEKGEPGPKGADGKSPTAAEVAADPVLQTHVANIGIRKAVQEEMSQPFDIPADDSTPISTDW